MVASSGGQSSKKQSSALFEKNPRSYVIGGAIQPVKDLTRFVRWPKYIRIQRQKSVLMMRLKVPPTINQFRHTVDRNQCKRFLFNIIADKLIKLLTKYAPETRKQKKERLVKEAEIKNAKKDPKKESPKPTVLKYGLNHITSLIEEKKAQLVVIAHDVEPIEMVLFLPTLCRKMGVPFCFVKGKARLGKLVHKKTATAVALTDVKKEDVAELDLLKKNFQSEFNDNRDLLRKWGGGIMGIKNQHMMAARKRQQEIEMAKKSKI